MHERTDELSETRELLDGLGFPESTRWREGRVWVCNWGAGEVIAVSPDGAHEVVARLAPHTLPFSIDWLPDGTLLIVDGPRRLVLAGGQTDRLTRSPISPALVPRRSTNSWPTRPATHTSTEGRASWSWLAGTGPCARLRVT